MPDIVSFVVEGEPASKANSRRIVMRHARPAVIKSEKALQYAGLFVLQCPKIELVLDDVEVEIDIYYRTRRPDLDESLILDLMQGCVYKNDRQVRSKIVRGHVDKDRPRAEIKVRRY